MGDGRGRRRFCEPARRRGRPGDTRMSISSKKVLFCVYIHPYEDKVMPLGGMNSYIMRRSICQSGSS